MHGADPWSEGLNYEMGTVGGVIAEGVRNNERLLIDDKSLAEALFQRAAPWLPQEVRLEPNTCYERT